jgi:hypothetical protein
MALIALMMILVALNGVVSFGITSFISSTILAVIASAVITEMLVAIYFLNQARHSPDAADVILGANIVAMLSTPLILATSWGFVFCWRRVRQKHSS